MKIAGVGWWSAGGGCRDERYGERETERERATESMGEMDHPVSGCIMSGKNRSKVWDEI